MICCLMGFENLFLTIAGLSKYINILILKLPPKEEEIEEINDDLNEETIRKNLEKLASKKRGTPKASKVEKTKSPKPAKKVAVFFFLSDMNDNSSIQFENHLFH